MVAHTGSASHHVAISLADLNTWCYQCDAYVINREVDAAYRSLHFIKFGSLPGENLAVVFGSGNNKKINILGGAETEESEDKLREKIKILGDWVKKSKSCVVFTGAGISTSAKIPDFRGPEGVWTLKAKGIATSESLKLESAVPTPCHMAIVSLHSYFQTKHGSFYVVSQNIDGLHRRSGLDKSLLSELHGNSFMEICWKCEKDYLRTFDTAASSGLGGANCKECLARVPKFCHCTARKCDCGAVLKDSIIHFGEDLPKVDLTNAIKRASNADLCIVLGSSLTVAPANQIPQRTKKNDGKVVIVNLQETIHDGLADLRIFGKTDLVMQILAEELGIQIPKFDLGNYF